MAYLYDVDDKLSILDRVDDGVLTLPDPITLLAGQFLTTRRARVIGE